MTPRGKKHGVFFLFWPAQQSYHTVISCMRTQVYIGEHSLLYTCCTPVTLLLSFSEFRESVVFSLPFFKKNIIYYFPHCVLRNMDAEVFKMMQYSEIE